MALWPVQNSEMRIKRLLDDRGGVTYYHCLSRVIERRYIFDEQAREHFKKLMRQQEAFSGVRVLTWTCMSNHFHVLVAVEDRKSQEVVDELEHLMENDAAFLRRLGKIYEPMALEEIEKLLKMVRSGSAAGGNDAKEKGKRGQKAQAMPTVKVSKEEREEHIRKEIARIKEPFLKRMHKLSCFVGELKQRISQWYNLKNERTGPLWEDRYKSVLVQGTAGVLATVAAYIDLNAVRAGLVKEPKDWRWCGYAEAAAAKSLAREGIYEVLGEDGATARDGQAWRKVHQRYRSILIPEAMQRRDEEDRVVRRGLTPAEVEAAEAEGFELPNSALLRHRVRYFCDGLALGSADFVDGIFRRKRRALGVKRKVGPRVPKLDGLGSLCTLRDLRSEVA